MSQQLVARVTCPNCQNQFQARVEQVLDVRADPGAKSRVINGSVNVAICPQCGMGGPLDLPFLYHDPENELALIYMPMQAGQDNLQRQKAIGDFTRAVMDQLPPEERKAYLLQPQEFLSMENLRNKVLEVEGITPEMIEAQQAKTALLGEMLQSTSDEALETLIEENEESIDEEFFTLLSVNLQMLRSRGADEGVERLQAVRDKLLEMTDLGRKVQARAEMLGALEEEPTRDKLLELLIEAPDAETRAALVSFGGSLIDYPFFQKLSAQIDSASEDEKARLTDLRKEILDLRDQFEQQAREILEERSSLLRDLMLSSDPENLARRRMAEFDQPFFHLLTSEMEQAQANGNEEAVQTLQDIWNMIMRLSEESLPPVIRLLNRLMAAEDEGTIEQLLQRNRQLVTPQFVEMLEQASAAMREDEEAEPGAADRLARIVAKAKVMGAMQSEGASGLVSE